MQIHPVNYLTEVFNFLIGSEGFNQGLPYFDTAKPTPKASIGYGVNIEVSDYLSIVLQTLGLFEGKTDVQIAAIQQTFTSAINSTAHGQGLIYDNALKLNLDKAAQQYGLPNFTISAPQATAAFYVILSGVTIGGKVIAGKETKLDKILKNSLQHDSKEYVAVMSMYYNVETLVKKGSKLVTAIINGNRAEAWFEICYNSNSDKGHASRRYTEANEFGLYDPGSAPTPDEAFSIYRMFTTHHQLKGSASHYFQSNHATSPTH